MNKKSLVPVSCCYAGSIPLAEKHGRPQDGARVERVIGRLANALSKRA